MEGNHPPNGKLSFDLESEASKKFNAQMNIQAKALDEILSPVKSISPFQNL